MEELCATPLLAAGSCTSSPHTNRPAKYKVVRMGRSSLHAHAVKQMHELAGLRPAQSLGFVVCASAVLQKVEIQESTLGRNNQESDARSGRRAGRPLQVADSSVHQFPDTSKFCFPTFC